MKLHRLLDILHPLLQLIAIIARQVKYQIVFIIEFEAMLILLLRELVSKTVIETDNLVKINDFHFLLISGLLREGEDINVLRLNIIKRLLALVLRKYAEICLQPEEAHELLFVQTSLGVEGALDHRQHFDLRFLKIIYVLLRLI